MIQAGNGIYLKLPYFADGGTGYARPFLIIETNELLNQLLLLNVSTIQGKEHKLTISSNEILKNYFPPFKKPSFVKMDVLYTVEYFSDLNKLIFKSRLLNFSELNRIQNKYREYRQTNHVKIISFDEKMIRNVNF